MKMIPRLLNRTGDAAPTDAFLAEYERAVLLELHRTGLLDRETLEDAMEKSAIRARR